MQGGNLYLCNLHGGTGNQREATWMVRKIHSAISRGEMNSVIIVSPQAMPERKELFFIKISNSIDIAIYRKD